MSFCRNLLWKDFFRDPTQFYDVRKNKKSRKSPDFQHRCTGKGLWIDRNYKPPWVYVKLQNVDLGSLETGDERVSIINLIKSCGSKKDVCTLKRILAEKAWIIEDVSIANTLIRSYAKCGALKDAREVYDCLSTRNVVSYNALIAGYADQGFGEEALGCFTEMRKDVVAPNAVTYTCSLKACTVVGSLENVEEIHARVRDQGLLNKHVALGSALVNAYAKCGAVKEAREVFDQLVERNVVTWSALITGYADHGFGKEAIACFREMENDGVKPDTVAYTCCLKACVIVRDLALVEEIHGRLTEQGTFNKNIVLVNALINAYAKCDAIKEAREVFDKLAERDVVSWSALIAGYADNGFAEEALKYFQEMGNNGMKPNSVTYICSLKACAFVGALDVVQKIHAQVQEQGLLDKDVVMGTALVTAYAKCGVLKETLEVFNQFAEREVKFWNALLAGYVQLGQINKMIELFDRMMAEGILPDRVTFLISLIGCSQGSLLKEGKQLFCIIGKYSRSLIPEQYTCCMVDLFGRAGQFDNAKRFMLDDASALLAFLDACQKWVNVDLGRWAFEKMLQLDEKSANAYICMANIYAAAGMVKEANEVQLLREAAFDVHHSNAQLVD